MSPICQLTSTPLPGVIVTRSHSASRFPRHWHDTFGLGLIEHGAQRSGSGRGPVDAWPGQCITHNPGEVHDGAPIGSEGRRWHMVEMAPAALAALLGVPTASALEWRAPVIDDPQLRNACQRALAHVASAPLLEEALMLALGRTLQAAPAGEAAAASSLGDARLVAVRERLTDDLACAPTLDELAALADTSRYGLVRHFARQHGLPPMAWLQQVRLHRAREQIAAGCALADAAQACGFSDQSHFTRLFRRQFGYTPGAWRAALRTDARDAIAF